CDEDRNTPVSGGALALPIVDRACTWCQYLEKPPMLSAGQGHPSPRAGLHSANFLARQPHGPTTRSTRLAARASEQRALLNGRGGFEPEPPPWPPAQVERRLTTNAGTTQNIRSPTPPGTD